MLSCILISFYVTFQLFNLLIDSQKTRERSHTAFCLMLWYELELPTKLLRKLQSPLETFLIQKVIGQHHPKRFFPFAEFQDTQSPQFHNGKGPIAMRSMFSSCLSASK